MAINRLLTLASATAIGLTMAGGANAITIGPDGLGLGFGKFLGTWVTNPPSGSDMPNPGENNVLEVGTAILAENPGLFDINDFHLAGLADNYGSEAPDTEVPLFNSNGEGIGFRVNSDSDPYSARWDYYGFADAGIFPPGDDPVDLYIAVKYSTFVSVFKYGIVNPGDFGYLSSDFADILFQPTTVWRPD